MYGSATSAIVRADWTRVQTAELLERILDRERVQHGREHAGVVARGAIHAGARSREAAEDVPAADDDRDLRRRGRGRR